MVVVIALFPDEIQVITQKGADVVNVASTVP